MEFKYNLNGNVVPWYKRLPFYDATTIVNGEAVSRGTTDATNTGCVITCVATGIDFVGMSAETVTSFGAQATGTQLNDANLHDVLIDPFAVYEIEYSQSDVILATSSSGTDVNVTGAEDGIAGGWLYVATGTGAGELRYVKDSDTNKWVTATAFSTTLDGTSGLVKIFPTFHKLGKLTSDGLSLGTDAAAGTLQMVVWDNFISATTIPKEKLSLEKHEGLTGLQNKGVRFFAHVSFRHHIAIDSN